MVLFKRSSFVEYLENGERAALFHRLNMNVVEGKKSDFKIWDAFLTPSTPSKFNKSEFNLLKKLEMLIPESTTPEEELSIYRKRLSETVRPNRLRMVLTEACNFSCNYCFVNRDSTNLSWDDAKKALDLLIKSNSGKKMEIQFFGGEPLIRVDLIHKIVEYMKDEDVIYYLTTNGSLVTDELIDFFKKNEFIVGISIDGPKEVHDSNRKYRDGRGTYEDAKRAFEKVKSAGISCFILVTPSKDNLTNLFELVQFINTTFSPDYITVNMPQYGYGWGLDGKILSEQLKKITLYCNEAGVGLKAPSSQVLASLGSQTPVSRTCTSTNELASLSITVDGRVSYCPINFDKDLFPEILRTKDTFDSNLKKKWFEYSSLTDDFCKNCIAIGTCGGICPMQSIKLHGDQEQLIPDKEKCAFFKDFTSWAIFNF